LTSHDVDRFAWALEQATHLRARHHDRIDRENVARTIEQLGEADVEELRERVRILITALVRWAYNSDFRSSGSHLTISAQRQQIAQLIEESPSLKGVAERLVIDTYPEARRAAAMEDGPFRDAFPAGLPFLPSEVLDMNFLPDPYGDDATLGAGWWRKR
jgi:hypothetical protein